MCEQQEHDREVWFSVFERSPAAIPWCLTENLLHGPTRLVNSNTVHNAE